MAAPILKYPLDLTGSASTNLVTGEIHDLSDLAGHANRAFVLNYGPFYNQSVTIARVDTGVALTTSQYVLTELVLDMTLETGLSICSVIIITDSTLPSDLKVSVSAQMLGGEYSNSLDAMMQLINSLDLDNRQVYWNDILDKPAFWQPAPHYHAVGDIYGFEYLCAALERVTQAIYVGQQGTIQAIYQYVDHADGILQENIDTVTGNLDAEIDRAKEVEATLVSGTTGANTTNGDKQGLSLYMGSDGFPRFSYTGGSIVLGRSEDLSNYLPLAGGTMTGNIQMLDKSILSGTGTNSCSIYFNGGHIEFHDYQGNVKAWWGMGSGDGAGNFNCNTVSNFSGLATFNGGLTATGSISFPAASLTEAMVSGLTSDLSDRMLNYAGMGTNDLRAQGMHLTPAAYASDVFNGSKFDTPQFSWLVSGAFNNVSMATIPMLNAVVTQLSATMSNGYLPLSGGTLTGTLTVNSTIYGGSNTVNLVYGPSNAYKASFQNDGNMVFYNGTTGFASFKDTGCSITPALTLAGLLTVNNDIQLGGHSIRAATSLLQFQTTGHINVYDNSSNLIWWWSMSDGNSPSVNANYIINANGGISVQNGYTMRGSGRIYYGSNNGMSVSPQGDGNFVWYNGTTSIANIAANAATFNVPVGIGGTLSVSGSTTLNGGLSMNGSDIYMNGRTIFAGANSERFEPGGNISYYSGSTLLGYWDMSNDLLNVATSKIGNLTITSAINVPSGTLLRGDLGLGGSDLKGVGMHVSPSGLNGYNLPRAQWNDTSGTLQNVGLITTDMVGWGTISGGWYVRVGNVLIQAFTAAATTVGDSTINFPTSYSDTPVVTVSYKDANAGISAISNIQSISSSSVVLYDRALNNSGWVGSSGTAWIIAVGPT